MNAFAIYKYKNPLSHKRWCTMVYCPRCGKQNEEGARFCNSCGASLMGPPPRKEFDKECERDCSGTSRSSRIFWGVIILMVGLWFIFEFGIKNISGMPAWIATFEFWWIFAVVIGIMIVIAAIRMLTKKDVH
jgi:hypothetical protein